MNLAAGSGQTAGRREGVRDVHVQLGCMAHDLDRFTSPHPKDFPPALLQLIAERANICKALHLPAQSGSTSVLHRMRRGYTREAYLALVSRRLALPAHLHKAVLCDATAVRWHACTGGARSDPHSGRIAVVRLHQRVLRGDRGRARRHDQPHGGGGLRAGIHVSRVSGIYSSGEVG